MEDVGGVAGRGPVFADRFVAIRPLKRARGVATLLGRDTSSGNEVIIKAIAPATTPAGGWMQLEHEAALLSRLGEGTPASVLCWTRDADAGGVLVRPFVAGMTLEALLRDGPLPIGEAITIVRGVLGDLASTHRLGVLHRDVKPANIILGAPGGPGVLVDFVISRPRIGDEALLDQPVEAGAYLSPEQAGILERGIDARSDLYAVGLVLFECVTGRRPFNAPHIGELLRQHLTAEPPPLPSLRPEAPRALDAIVQHLLRKEPRDRYQSAAAAAADLAALAEALERGEDEPRLVVGTHDQRNTLSEPAFVGRERELAGLVEHMERARDGSGRLALVEARSGAGKTWLLEELVRRGAGNAWVLRGRGVDQSAHRPLQVLDGVLREIAASAHALPAVARRLAHTLDDDTRATLGRVPHLAALFGAPAVELGPEVHAEARLLPALAALLDALSSAERPALVLLDDVQWADELSLRLLELWGRRCLERGSHTAVVAAFRSEEIAEEHPLRHRLPVDTHLELAALSRDELRSVVESMAGPLPDEVVAVVAELSDGTPFMAAAVLHGLVESGALVAAPSGWDVDRAAMPEAQSGHHAAALLVRRLERFPAPALHFLTVGAVLGKAFDLERAAALAGVPPHTALEAVELGKQRQVVWLEARGARCVFVHDKLRDALLGRLDPAALRALHAAAARRIEEHEAANVFELAYHYDAAGEAERALPHALDAATQARARLALGLAEEQYRIALRGAAPADAGTRRAVHEGLGDTLMLRGSYDEAAAQLAAAAALADDDVARAALMGKIGELSFKRGDVRAASESIEHALRSLGRAVPRGALGFLVAAAFEAAVQLLHTALPRLFVARRDAARAAPDLLACRLLSRLAYAYWFYRGGVACLWAHLREMNLAERYPPTAELAQAYSEHAPVMTMIPWFARGVRYAARSLEIRRARGDVWGEGQSQNFHGVALYAAARFDECIERCGEATRLLRRAGDRWEENTAAWNVALARYRKGDLAAAVELARKVHAAAVVLGDRQAAAIALGIWAKASGGAVEEALIDAALAQPGEDVHAASELAQAHALRLMHAGRPDVAATVLAAAARRVAARGLRQEYVAPLWPWLATALRLSFEATPPLEHAHRAARLAAARRAARRALRVARRYPNNLPHARRELGLLAAMRGDEAAARQLLDASVAVARAQGARHELAQSLAARSAAGASFGWARAASDAADAGRLRAEPPAGGAPRALADSGPMRPITLALADRFSTLLAGGRRIVTALTVDGITAQLAEAAQALLRGDDAAVLRVDAAGELAGSGPLAGLDGLARRATTSARPQVGRGDELIAAGVKSALAVPVVARGNVEGCLCVVHRGVAGLFGVDERRLAQFLATLAGAALENARGFAELAEVQAKLAVAGRMATVGTLASGVAHEINNPLTYVLSNLSFMEGELAAAAAGDTEALTALRAALRDAATGAQRVRDIVRDLRTFARDDEERRALDVRGPLETALAMARNQIRHRARLVRQYDDVPPVLANEGRLGQLFLNVLVNAAQALPEDEDAGHEIRLVTRVERGKVVIAIHDSGAGIPPEIAERVFDPFFTTKPVGQGTGLGLSICHGIVTSLGGTIALDSVVGRGTTVTITLPPSATPAEAQQAPAAVVPATPTGRVLIIDDEPLVAWGIARLLSPAEVLVEIDGAAAIERIVAEGQTLDLILCDVMMPTVTGREVFEQVRGRAPGLEERMVFVTGGAFTARAREFLQSIPNRCLHKPVELADVRALLAARVAARA